MLAAVTNQARRYLIGTAVVLIGWYLCVIFLWAVKPLSDSVPTGVVKETNTSVSQAVSCHSLFSSSARGTSALPTVAEPLAYQRSACSLVHSDARVMFAIDTLLLVLALAALVVIAVRLSRDTDTSVVPA
jgi:hypothetical protein